MQITDLSKISPQIYDMDVEELKSKWYIFRRTPPKNQQILENHFIPDIGLVIEVSKYQDLNTNSWAYQIISVVYDPRRPINEFVPVSNWCETFESHETLINEQQCKQFLNDIMCDKINPGYFFTSILAK